MDQRIFIERTDADQSFHVRFVSANGRRTFWCENLRNRASAVKAVIRHAQTFQVDGSEPPVLVAAPLLASGQALRVDQGGVAYVDIEVVTVDSRARK